MLREDAVSDFPGKANLDRDPSKEAELPRLARLASTPLVPEAALLSWEEVAPSNSWQTSSSVKEVDSESWAPTEERLVRSEL